MRDKKELDDILDDLVSIREAKECTGFFVVFEFKDGSTYTKYETDDFIGLTGLVDVVNLDLKNQLIDSIYEEKIGIDKNKMN